MHNCTNLAHSPTFVQRMLQADLKTFLSDGNFNDNRISDTWNNYPNRNYQGDICTLHRICKPPNGTNAIGLAW